MDDKKLASFSLLPPSSHRHCICQGGKFKEKNKRAVIANSLLLVATVAVLGAAVDDKDLASSSLSSSHSSGEREAVALGVVGMMEKWPLPPSHHCIYQGGGVVGGGGDGGSRGRWRPRLLLLIIIVTFIGGRKGGGGGQRPRHLLIVLTLIGGKI